MGDLSTAYSIRSCILLFAFSVIHVPCHLHGSVSNNCTTQMTPNTEAYLSSPHPSSLSPRVQKYSQSYTAVRLISITTDNTTFVAATSNPPASRISSRTVANLTPLRSRSSAAFF